MIRQWGDWPLFQALLTTCRAVADRHSSSNATIATVAIAWVLRQQAVGGVIVGLRAGLSEHSAENARALELAEQLTGEDLAELTAASKSGRDLLTAIGDCGDEYRG
jgi:aryl-alcohol dehydrogenase-like predicted oxidoreductase